MNKYINKQDFVDVFKYLMGEFGDDAISLNFFNNFYNLSWIASDKVIKSYACYDIKDMYKAKKVVNHPIWKNPDIQMTDQPCLVFMIQKFPWNINTREIGRIDYYRYEPFGSIQDYSTTHIYKVTFRFIIISIIDIITFLEASLDSFIPIFELYLNHGWQEIKFYYNPSPPQPTVKCSTT